MHFSGVLAHQCGDRDRAVELIQRSIELDPERPDWYSNLGIVLRDRLQLDEAVHAFQRAIALDRDHVNAHNNLGVVLRAQGLLPEAEAAYHEAIRVNPDSLDAFTNLGILLNAQGRAREAVACFCKVITLRPKHPEARRLLALAHWTLGDHDKAIEVFEEWLKEEPKLTCPVPKGAFYLYPSVEAFLSSNGFPTSQAFTDSLLAKEHVIVTPAEAFEHTGAFRLSYAASLETLREGVTRIIRHARGH